MKLTSTILIVGAVLSEPVPPLFFRPLTQAEAVARVRAIKKDSASSTRLEREVVADGDTAIWLAISAWKSAFASDTGWPTSDFRAYRADDCWLVTKSRSEFGARFEAVIVAADGRFLTISPFPKPPNKPAQPTPGSVTPRASESTSK